MRIELTASANGLDAGYDKKKREREKSKLIPKLLA